MISTSPIAHPHAIIRRAVSADAGAVARLATQLGYPGEEAVVGQRLHDLGVRSDHAVLVAETTSDASVVGWLHVSLCPLVYSGEYAEVHALVVHEGHRGAGAGSALMAAAEQWAREHRCSAIRLRSNVVRERTHSFYLKLGYTHIKTQKAFRKAL